MGRHKRKDFHLPPRMRKSHGAYYWTPRVGGKQIYQRLSSDIEEAMAEYTRLERLASTGTPVEYKAIKDVPLHLFRKTRNGAKHRKIEFSIDLEYVRQLYDESKGKCSVTGIPFEFSYKTGERQPPWAPSIDRINSGEGYMPGNVRIVCSSVNVAMGQWGESVLRRIVQYMEKRRPNGK